MCELYLIKIEFRLANCKIEYFRKLGNASLFRRKSKDAAQEDETQPSGKDSVFKIIFKEVTRQVLLCSMFNVQFKFSKFKKSL